MNFLGLGSNSTKKKPSLQIWLNKVFGNQAFATKIRLKLIECDFTSAQEISVLPQDDLNDLCNECGLKFGKKAKFLNAVKEIKKKAAPAPAPAPSSSASASNVNDPDQKTNGNILAPPSNRQRFSPGFHHVKSVKSVQFCPAFCPNPKHKKRVRGMGKLQSISSNKVIMVVGQTGAGKTTFLNSMLNYIYNVEYEDEFRLKLIVEPKKIGGQAVSQTDHITSYHIKKPIGGKIHYDLTVIDTPGFGDTRGMDHDVEIMKSIKEFFETVLDSIDAICFIIKATETRLSGSQQYIFNSVLNLWGKNVKENIFLLLTFADASDPPVMDAIRQEGTVASCKYYKLNNSVYKKDPKKIKLSNPAEKMFDKMFWQMGTLCFDAFFKGLTTVPSKSVSASRQVLRQRDAIATTIGAMASKLDIALSRQRELEKQKKYVQEHKDELNTYNEAPYYESQKYHVTESRNSSVITTCMVCANRTCHPGCSVSNKASCCMMGSGGYCKLCGCHYSKHNNQSYVWVEKYRQVRKSKWNDNPNRKNKYNNAKQKMTRSQNIIHNTQTAISNVENNIKSMIGAIHGCIKKLEAIALRPTVSTVGDYIDKLIAAETEKKPNKRDNDKIKRLKQYRRQEKFIEQIEKNQNISLKDLMNSI